MILKIIFSIIFISILGVAKSQVSFFVKPDFSVKMSFNSNSFSPWDDKTVKVSDLFTYENKSYYLGNPFRLGLSIGVNVKTKHEFIFSLSYDGVSSKQTLRFATYEPSINTIIPNRSYSKSRTQQNRACLSYSYFFFNKPNKTTFYIAPTISLVFRAGKSEIEKGGSFSFEAQLPNNVVGEFTDTDYTSTVKYSMGYGMRFGTDIHNNKRYLFSLSLGFSYSNNYLYILQTKVNLFDGNTNKIINYEFQSYGLASGVYLTFSKKFQIYPWKKRKNKD